MSNLFKQFTALLPARPLMVGTVASNSGGVATITLPGGGVMQARGGAAAGVRVFFRDGVIEGTAPTLSIEVIEI